MRRLLGVLCLVALAAVARADEQAWGLDVLRGLRSLDVLVEPISVDLEKEGVRRSTLQADMELRLRRAGISIVTDSTATWPDSAVLRLRVDDMKREQDQGTFHEFRITLEVVQGVALLRDPAVRGTNASWHRTLDGTQLSAVVVRSVRDGVRELMEHLIDDYLAANSGTVRRLVTGPKRKRRPEGD